MGFTPAKIYSSPSRNNILCIGDSLTALDEFATAWHSSFPTWLEGKPGLSVVNKGVGGYRIQDLIDNFDTLVTSVTPRPSVCTVLIGTNDASYALSLADYIAAYKILIGRIVALGITPVLMTTPPHAHTGYETAVPILRTYSNFIREFAIINGYPLIDVGTLLSNADGSANTSLLRDNIHTNSAGAKLIADKLYTSSPATSIMPYVATEEPWTIPGGENLVTNPIFASTLGTGWSTLSTEGTGRTATVSYPDHATDGKYLQFAATGGADLTAAVFTHQMVSVTPGKRYQFSVDLDVADITGTVYNFPYLIWLNSTPEAISVLPTAWCDCAVEAYRYRVKATAPAGAASLWVQLRSVGTGSCTTKFSRVMVREIPIL